MVQGVSSDAGKSVVTTALCRWLHRRGVKVAPFKAQNMSNNARVVDGGEIGTAQWLQALASGVQPDVRMNPVLLKPESHTRSQVVLRGRVDHQLTAAPWRGRSARLWPVVTEALSSLLEQFEVVVIEGAGSPAETNLWGDDIANMAVADWADAPVALVADIDRGGAFAHLYGTWALLLPRWQARVRGFVLNKFRGDPALLEPAPKDLEAACGVPVVGVLPWLDHGLPDEEGPTLIESSRKDKTVSIICGPYASNLDEFVALQQVATVRWVRHPADLGGADLIVVPGSKHVANDLAWLRARGLAQAVSDAARNGVAVLGICGGLQALGERLEDPAGVEGSSQGLGLLPLCTTYGRTKRTEASSVALGPLAAPWDWLANRRIRGYEIHHGVTRVTGDIEVATGAVVFGQANVCGVYLHGIFEDPEVVESFCGRRPAPLERAFESLADAVETYLDLPWIAAHLGG